MDSEQRINSFSMGNSTHDDWLEFSNYLLSIIIKIPVPAGFVPRQFAAVLRHRDSVESSGTCLMYVSNADCIHIQWQIIGQLFFVGGSTFNDFCFTE